MRIPKARLSSAAAIGLAALLAQPAFAQTTKTATSDMAISTEVTSNCTVTSSPVDFGQVNATTGLAIDGLGGISVVCTKGTPWVASADKGAGTTATVAARQLTGPPGGTLNYGLFTEATHTTVWGDGTTTTATLADTGTGVAQDKIIYGEIAASQTGAPAGNYTDTVGVSVVY